MLNVMTTYYMVQIILFDFETKDTLRRAYEAQYALVKFQKKHQSCINDVSTLRDKGVHY